MPNRAKQKRPPSPYGRQYQHFLSKFLCYCGPVPHHMPFYWATAPGARDQLDCILRKRSSTQPAVKTTTKVYFGLSRLFLPLLIQCQLSFNVATIGRTGGNTQMASQTMFLPLIIVDQIGLHPCLCLRPLIASSCSPPLEIASRPT